MSEKNSFLYDTTALFEESRRAKAHQNFNAHIWTPRVAEEFGAKKGEPFIGTDGRTYYTAFYDTPEAGELASKAVIDSIWDKSEGNALRFASIHTGLPEQDQRVINYAKEIDRRKNLQNLEGAKQRVNNNLALQKKKEDLYAEFPTKEKQVDKLIDTGLYNIDGIRDELNKTKEKTEFTDKMYQTFKESMTYMGLDDEAVGVKNALLRGIENVKSLYHTTAITLGKDPADHVKDLAVAQATAQGIPATEAMQRMMNPDNTFGETLDEFGGDPFEIVAQLWTESMTQFMPAYAPLATVAVPTGALLGGGAGAIVGNMTASGLASYSIEMAHETIQLMRENGVDVTNEDELAMAFANEELMATIKRKANLKAIPIALLDALSAGIAGRVIATARRAGTPVITARGREMLEQAGLGGLGEFTGQGLQMDEPFQEGFNIPAIFAESVVEIAQGTVEGTVNLVFTNGNSIEVPENDPLVQDLISAKNKQLQEPSNDVEQLYSDRVVGLKNYKDKISIGFSSAPIEEVFSEQELNRLGYNPSQFEQLRIKEGENDYVDDGANRYRIPVRATNYEHEDGTRRILLSKDANQADFLEDTAEAVFARLPENNSELALDIAGWIEGVENESLVRGEELPYSGAELFSKSFLNSLGYDVSTNNVALPDYTVLPDDLLNSFKEELSEDDGSNLVDGFDMSVINQRETKPIERKQAEKPVEVEEGFAFASTQEVLDRLRSNKPIIQKGETIKPDTFKKLASRIVTRGTADIAKFSEQDPDVVTKPRSWYRQDIENTISIAEQEMPDIRENESYFKTLLGILSNGQPVAINYNQAMEVYGRTDGDKLPFVSYTSDKGKTFDAFGGLSKTGKPFGGVRADNVTSQGEQLQVLVNEFGKGKKLTDFLLTKFDSKTLKSKYGLAKSTPEGDYFGARIFGKKIGAYIVNMHGVHEEAVLDVWMARMFDRYTGAVTPDFSSQKLKVMNNAISRIAKKLEKTTGMDWGVDQVQAVLWYIEKETYIQAGVKPEKGESYLDVAKRRQQALGRQFPTASTGVENINTNEEQGDAGQGRNRQGQRSDERGATEGFSLSSEDVNRYAKIYDDSLSKRQIKRDEKEAKQYKPKQTRDYLRTWSSQVNRIDPRITELFRRFQKRESDILREYTKASEPFAKTLKRLSTRSGKRLATKKTKATYTALKLALLNGDTDTVSKILTGRQYKQYQTWKTAHEKLHEQALAVGLDMGHIDNHFPREVVAYDSYLKWATGKTTVGKKSKLTEAIIDAQTKIGRTLTDVEKVSLANTLLKNENGVLTTANVNWTKPRKIDVVTDDILKFYDDPHNTLARYANGMSKRIAQAQFLGGRPNRYSIRKLPKELKAKGLGIYDNKIRQFYQDENGLIVFQNRRDPAIGNYLEALRMLEQERNGLPYLSTKDQIGNMIIDIQTRVPLNQPQVQRLQQLMEDYFRNDSSHWFFSGFRNLGYLSSMGSIFSAITQLGDLGVSIYRQAQGRTLGLFRPSTYTRILSEVFKSLTNLNKYKLKNLGIDNKVLQELSDNQTVLQRITSIVFSLSLLKTFDKVGKESYMNSVMKKYEKASKQAIKGKNNKAVKDLRSRIGSKFDRSETEQVIRDLSRGKVTELTELLAYSELLDIQPVARSEVPVGYMRHPNGRIFYMLKTFMLKRFDIYVNETQRLVKQGKPVQAISNLFFLGFILASAEASADTIKDWMAGRKTPLGELVEANLLKLIGFSRYHYYNVINSEPSKAVAKFFFPPFDYIDDPWLDYKFIKGRLDRYKNTQNAWKFAMRDFEKRGARWIKHIPVFGKHLYWQNPKKESGFIAGLAEVLNRISPLFAKGAGRISLEKRQAKEKREQRKN